MQSSTAVCTQAANPKQKHGSSPRGNSTQSTHVSAASTTKLESSGVGHSRNKPPEVSSFVAQQDLCERIATLSKPTVHDLQPLDLHQEALFLNLVHDMSGQLVCRVKAGATSFTETYLTTSDGQKGAAVWSRQGEDCVVLVAVDVQVVGRSSVGVRILDHVGFEAFSHPGVVRATARGRCA